MSNGLVSGAVGLSGVLCCGAAVAAWRRRTAPAAGAFAVAAAVTGVGALVIGGCVAFGLPHAATLGTAIIVGLMMPVPWLLFAFEYTGRSGVLSFSVAGAAAVLPVLGLVATVIVFGFRLLPGAMLPAQSDASGLAAVVVSLLSVTQLFALVYAGGLMLLGTAVLVVTFQRYDHLDSTGGVLLGTFGTVPWLSILFGLRIDGVAPLALATTVAVGMFVGGIAAAGAVGPYRLFRSVPAAGNVGPATVVEELSDLVVVTDDDGVVVELNGAASRALDATAPEVVGADVETALGADIETLQGTDTVELRSPSGRTVFEPTVSALTDQHDRLLGYAVVLRDVTVRTTRQQRLEVFNRVLRHNLSNDVNVVLGHAERLRSALDDSDLLDSADTIVRTARKLVEVSETARETEQVIDATGVGPSARLADLVEEARAGVDADPERDIPPGLVIEDGAPLLRLALSHLIENAVEHNDTDRQWVRVSATVDPEAAYPLSVSVADNGPGIPETERRVVESGTESSLEHGSGLGLWIVRWSVTLLGGELGFRERSPEGSVVTLSLPSVRQAETDETRESRPVR